MAVTLATLVTRLERRVVDLSASVSAESQTLIERAHRELQDLHNFKVMEGLLSFTTDSTADEPEVLSADLGQANFKEWRGRPYIQPDDNGVSYPLTLVNESDAVRMGFIQDADLAPGRPQIVVHRRPDSVGDAFTSHALEVWPAPDGLANTSDGEYVIRLPYYSYLSVPASSDWFTDNAYDFLLESATAEAFALNWDFEKYALWRAKAYGPLWDARGIMGGQLARVVNLDKRFRVSNVDTLAPYSGANDFRLRL